MDRELEDLLVAFDAAKEAAGTERSRLEFIYESRLDGIIARSHGLTRERLHVAVLVAHHRWLRAQGKPSSLPPKA
jgi:hypothetical protein